MNIQIRSFAYLIMGKRHVSKLQLGTKFIVYDKP